MCPLGNNCPGYTGARWPTSSIKTTTPLGNKCPFAHTYLELKFEAEEKVKKKILKKMYKDVEFHYNEKVKRDVFYPACAKIVSCNGCGHEIRKKGCKGVCNYCKVNLLVNKKLEDFRTEALVKYKLLTNTEKFKKRWK